MSTALPPIAKISLIGIFVETVLYGVNCVMYALCMFALLCRGKTATLPRVLIAVSTILFLLGTVHVGASLQQLLNAFVYVPADLPNYSTTYWLDYTATLRVLKDNVYATMIFVQYFVLTWRLYVVFMYNWKVTVFPIILAFGGLGLMYASAAADALSNDGSSSSVIMLIVPAWVCGFIHNVSVTGAIVARLWWMGRTIASLTGISISNNRLSSSIYIIVESGAISLVCSTVILVLFTSGSLASFSSLDVAAQLCVLTPLLIVVQVQKTGDSSKRIPDPVIFRAVDCPEQDGVTLDTRLARSPTLPMTRILDS